MIRGNVELSVIRGKVETECDQGKRGKLSVIRGTWKLSVIRGNVETECDQGKRGN